MLLVQSRRSFTGFRAQTAPLSRIAWDHSALQIRATRPPTKTARIGGRLQTDPVGRVPKAALEIFELGTQHICRPSPARHSPCHPWRAGHDVRGSRLANGRATHPPGFADTQPRGCLPAPVEFPAPTSSASAVGSILRLNTSPTTTQAACHSMHGWPKSLVQQHINLVQLPFRDEN